MFGTSKARLTISPEVLNKNYVILKGLRLDIEDESVINDILSIDVGSV